MSLKDRIREAAQQAQDGLAKGAQQAQEGLAKGQAKLEQFQKERQSAGSELEALGQAYWVVQSGRGTTQQLEALLEVVRPAISQSEAQNGPLPWPAVPTAAGTAPSPAGAPTPPPPAAYPTTAADPTTAAPESAAPESAAPESAVSGPVGAGPASFGIPTAIHHDEPID
jgi:hypothetical protein